MFTRLYVDALLVNPELADQVWDAWDTGIITDEKAALAWCILSAENQIGPDDYCYEH